MARDLSWPDCEQRRCGHATDVCQDPEGSRRLQGVMRQDTVSDSLWPLSRRQRRWTWLRSSADRVSAAPPCQSARAARVWDQGHVSHGSQSPSGVVQSVCVSLQQLMRRRPDTPDAGCSSRQRKREASERATENSEAGEASRQASAMIVRAPTTTTAICADDVLLCLPSCGPVTSCLLLHVPLLTHSQAASDSSQTCPTTRIGVSCLACADRM